MFPAGLCKCSNGQATPLPAHLRAATPLPRPSLAPPQHFKSMYLVTSGRSSQISDLTPTLLFQLSPANVLNSLLIYLVSFLSPTRKWAPQGKDFCMSCWLLCTQFLEQCSAQLKYTNICWMKYFVWIFWLNFRHHQWDSTASITTVFYHLPDPFKLRHGYVNCFGQWNVNGNIGSVTLQCLKTSAGYSMLLFPA